MHVAAWPSRPETQEVGSCVDHVPDTSNKRKMQRPDVTIKYSEPQFKGIGAKPDEKGGAERDSQQRHEHEAKEHTSRLGRDAHREEG